MIELPGPGPAVWDALAARGRNVFGTRAWAECWWQAYGGSSEPLVLQDAADPSVLVPLCVSRGPVRQVRLIGGGPADELGPVGPPERHAAAADLVRTALRERGGWDVLLLQDVAVDAGWDGRLGARVLRVEPGPVLDLPVGGWDDFLATRSKNFREQARRRERKLRARFAVTLREATGPTLEADLDTLFRLHRARWGDQAPFATGRQARFTRHFAEAALAAGRLRLHVLELDERPAAALMGLRFAGVESFYQSGRDPGLEEHSVGSVLLLAAVRAAVEDGAQEYRLLRGAEGYKSRLADRDRPVHTVALARGPVGRVAVAVAARRAARAAGAAAAAQRKDV